MSALSPERRRGAHRWAPRFLVAMVVLAGVTRLAADPVVPRLIVTPAPAQARIPAAAAPVAGVAPGRIRSVLNVRAPMHYGDYVWNEAAVPAAPIWVRVDRGAQLISVFRGADEIGTAVILYGAAEKPTPAGRYPVLEKRRDHRSSTYDAPMPYTLRLTGDGVSIHAASVREGAATHGCIGLPEEFARRLFDRIPVGGEVVIV